MERREAALLRLLVDVGAALHQKLYHLQMVEPGGEVERADAVLVRVVDRVPNAHRVANVLLARQLLEEALAVALAAKLQEYHTYIDHIYVYSLPCLCQIT